MPRAGAAFMAICDSEGAALHLPWLRRRPGRLRRGHAPPPARRRPAPRGADPQGAAGARAHPPAAARRARARTTCSSRPTAHRPAPAIASVTAPITSKAEAATRFFTPPLVHDAGGPGRRARARGAVRLQRDRPAAQPADHRTPLRRRHGAARGPRLRAGDRVASHAGPATLIDASDGELTESQVRALAEALQLPMTRRGRRRGHASPQRVHRGARPVDRAGRRRRRRRRPPRSIRIASDASPAGYAPSIRIRLVVAVGYAWVGSPARGVVATARSPARSAGRSHTNASAPERAGRP